MLSSLWYNSRVNENYLWQEQNQVSVVVLLLSPSPRKPVKVVVNTPSMLQPLEIMQKNVIEDKVSNEHTTVVFKRHGSMEMVPN